MLVCMLSVVVNVMAVATVDVFIVIDIGFISDVVVLVVVYGTP